MTPSPGRDWVAVTLAIGVATALNIFTFAVLYDAIFAERAGLSENGTQVLTGWGGGVIGVLGAYIGGLARARHTNNRQDDDDDEPTAN